MKYITILLILCSTTCCGQDAGLKAAAFADSVFSKNTLKVELIDFVFDKELERIMLKMQQSIAENKDWFTKFYSENYVAGEGLPYHEKFGLTKDEYQKIESMGRTSTKVVIRDSASVAVMRSQSTITFKSDHKILKLFGFLSYDRKRNQWLLRNDTIPFKQAIATSADTPFGKWNGYSWAIERSNQKENDAINLEKLTAKIVNIQIGIIASTGKLLFRFQYREVDNGNALANADLGMFLR